MYWLTVAHERVDVEEQQYMILHVVVNCIVDKSHCYDHGLLGPFLVHDLDGLNFHVNSAMCGRSMHALLH